MNQKGEITLVGCLLVLALSSLVLLCSLELNRSFKLLQKRTKLFLCVKETKGELHRFMIFMGRTNWAIRNINRVSLIMLFIPGLQGASMNAHEMKKYLQYIQEGKLVSYLKTLNDLRAKSCPLDPRLFITPFRSGTRLLMRDADGATILRNNEWTYYFYSHSSFLSLKIRPINWENVNPSLNYFVQEKKVKLSSLSFSR